MRAQHMTKFIITPMVFVLAAAVVLVAFVVSAIVDPFDRAA